MIDLTSKPVLRESQNYKIFDHPEMDGALLKVRTDKPKNRKFRRYSEMRYGNLRQWNREANEYLAALSRGCPELERLAGFYGFARTSKGPAIVVEKMTGPDGELAQTFSEEMKQYREGDPKRLELLQEIDDLMTDLERGRIVVGDISRQNVVRAQERGGRLVVIDGVGERTLIPLTLFSDRAFRVSIERRRKFLRGKGR